MEDMKRRDFLKVLGGAGVAAAVVAAGCKHPNEISAEGFSEGEVPTDKMTYRKDTHGEKVSLLGYGCMRLPVVDENAEDKVIDQEMVNKETDYAIAHGMTYFDTAPVYCKGKSEHAVGVALSRHKRNEFTIATKLSNFSNWTRENSIAMYKNSCTRASATPFALFPAIAITRRWRRRSARAGRRCTALAGKRPRRASVRPARSSLCCPCTRALRPRASAWSRQCVRGAERS